MTIVTEHNCQSVFFTFGAVCTAKNVMLFKHPRTTAKKTAVWMFRKNGLRFNSPFSAHTFPDRTEPSSAHPAAGHTFCEALG